MTATIGSGSIDIVDRLRSKGDLPWRTTLALEAADTIETLRSIIRSLSNCIDELDAQISSPGPVSQQQGAESERTPHGASQGTALTPGTRT